MLQRTSTPIRVGDVVVGGNAPITVQSMTKTDTRDVEATVAQIERLTRAGCEIVRSAVPDMEAANALASIRARISIPIIADIHFDHRLALASIDAGVDGLRLNPGNIRRRTHLQKVVAMAKERQIPIRVGVNGGSMPADYRAGELEPERMVALAMEQIGMLEDMDFGLIKVSLKSSDVLTTIEAYRLIADRIPYPLHLGVTEAGPPSTGGIRNALGIGILLHMGIGDTIRVSISGDPLLEVDNGREILRSLGLAQSGPQLISCPTCGRTTLDVPGLATRLSEYLRDIRIPLRIAVMGCTVNGPGECRSADIGIAGGVDKVMMYRGGTFLRSIPTEQAFEALTQEIASLAAAGSNHVE
ncbi:MAG: flavodoxin-dependent (E)-4-hydroxy-3-methylbut-2-enyl-diphosphate synthase [Dehalococcoidia bacterium]|nr:flavodoxin-dependent (E)-4-hydroxy-3-methylbut-2-enyl-diphosphate synthase [Dehalococcoidia bacterium]